MVNPWAASAWITRSEPTYEGLKLLILMILRRRWFRVPSLPMRD